MPRCPKCGEEKPPGEFPRNRARISGLHWNCKQCHRAQTKESISRLYGNSRHYHLTGRYGIGADEVAALIEQQGGICPICRRREPTHVDHDHKSGRVRAILCGPCNTGLGQFKDDPVRIRAAIEYLNKQAEVLR